MFKKFKNYWLVFDAFGIIPVWTIQHPKKEAKDGYWIMPNRPDVMKLDWVKEVKRIKKALDKLSLCNITISGEMICGYDEDVKQKIITVLKIETITLYIDESSPLYDPEMTADGEKL